MFLDSLKFKNNNRRWNLLFPLINDKVWPDSLFFSNAFPLFWQGTTIWLWIIVCYSYIAVVGGNVCTSKRREQQSIKTKDILGNHHCFSGLRLKELATQFNLCYNNSSHSSSTMWCCWHRKWEDNEYFRIVKEKNSQDNEDRQARANKAESKVVKLEPKALESAAI